MTNEEWRAYYKTLQTPAQTLSLDEWTKYRDILESLSTRAADEFRDAVWNINGRWRGVGLGKIPRDELVDYAYALVTKYSEGATSIACEFYDALAALQGVDVPPAVPADTASYGEVAKAVNGAIKQSESESIVSGAVGRLVKQAGQDTTLQNAARDGAEAAWIPNGDTCAYCLTLAARGWQPVSTKTIKGGHAEHIHANCDCAYGVRFSSSFNVEGYNPGAYKRMYDRADGVSSKAKINSLRREQYARDADKINAQKRAAYAARMERENADE